MAVTVKTREEIGLLREGGRRLARALRGVAGAASSGVSTLQLDAIAERLIRDEGGIPAFKGYRIKEASIGYPASICASVNDEVVHAIPRKDKILREGDILSLDIGMWWPREEFGICNLEFGKESLQPPTSNLQPPLVTDMAITIGIGKISPEATRLIQDTEHALDIGIAAVRAGARVGDISHAIQNYLDTEHLGIIRDLAGHGVGYKLHEEPLIPNYGKPGTGPEIREGMVIAIEPMATLGGWRIRLDDDEWTFRTADGSLAAHFEHTIAVTAKGAVVVTSAD